MAILDGAVGGFACSVTVDEPKPGRPPDAFTMALSRVCRPVFAPGINMQNECKG